MHKTFAPHLLTVAAVVVLAAPAFTFAANGADQFGDPAPGPMVVAANTNLYAIASGGVSDEDRARMQADAGNYSMRLVFSETNGQYIVADHVSLKKGGSEVMAVNDVGPLVYAKVPPGQYQLTVSYKGVTQTKSVNVGGKAGDVHMVWPLALD